MLKEAQRTDNYDVRRRDVLPVRSSLGVYGKMLWCTYTYHKSTDRIHPSRSHLFWSMGIRRHLQGPMQTYFCARGIVAYPYFPVSRRQHLRG